MEKTLSHRLQLEPTPALLCIQLQQQSKQLAARHHHDKFSCNLLQATMLKVLEAAKGTAFVLVPVPCKNHDTYKSKNNHFHPPSDSNT